MMKRAYLAVATIGSVIALYGTLAGAATPAFAEAGTNTVPQTMVVKYADLNLASAKDQKILERRIDKAAKKICGLDRARTGTRLKSRDAQDCYREAKANAAKQFAGLIKEQRIDG